MSEKKKAKKRSASARKAAPARQAGKAAARGGRREPARESGGAKSPARRRARAADVPSLFRINVEVGDLDRAAGLYGTLFGVDGRRQAGSRVYFTCGPVTLQVVDVSSSGAPHPAAKALYFTVRDLDAVHARAAALGCLSKDRVHGEPGGAIAVRPWGERSFYAEDPWGNPLCFVERGTIYPG